MPFDGALKSIYWSAKQHLGLLSVPTETFASHIASRNETAIRYLILMQAAFPHVDSRVCDARSHLNTQLETLDKAQTFMGNVSSSY
jgi:hypothetical protein